MISPTPEQILKTASYYFEKGRCSGHHQFNGRYCRDAAGPDRWCIHCAGLLLLSLLDRLDAEIARLTEAHERLKRLSAKWRQDADRSKLLQGLQCADDLDALLAPSEGPSSLQQERTS